MNIFVTRVRRWVRWFVYVLATRAPRSIIVAYLAMPVSSRAYAQGRRDRRAFAVVCEEKDFSTDWFTHNITSWVKVFTRPDLQSLLTGPLRGLEIGSWEGMSSTFLLRRFPALQLTCVDTWHGSDEHEGAERARESERRFRANTREFGDRVTAWKGSSLSYFAETEDLNGRDGHDAFDLIYVDGSHFVDDVLTDAILSFERLRVGGIIIFDDYQWRDYPELRSNPAVALNAFFRLKSFHLEILAVGHQIIARRIRPSLRTINPRPPIVSRA